MKLVTYRDPVGGSARAGAMTDGGIVDLTGPMGTRAPTVLALIEHAAGDPAVLAAAEAIAADPARPRITGAALDLPIPRPGKIICVGVNYADRNEEYKDGQAAPKFPSLFVRFPETFVPHGAPLMRPPESEQLDYEGEIVMVIGKSGRRVPRERALEHVLGWSIANEGSIRDWIRHGKFNVTQGKNFAASGSLGPCIVTADSLPAGPMRVTTRVNGEVRQNDTTASMIFDFSYLISYLSTFLPLSPGDIILTGTPTGAGARFDPPRWLKAGDVVEVEVSGIGTLTNTVSDEKV